jgi:hypothetical protein
VGNEKKEVLNEFTFEQHNCNLDADLYEIHGIGGGGVHSFLEYLPEKSREEMEALLNEIPDA